MNTLQIDPEDEIAEGFKAVQEEHANGYIDEDGYSDDEDDYEF